MPTNETRRELLNRAKASGYPGSITEVFQAADQGIDLIEQHQMQQQQQEMQVAQTPEQQEVGLREQHAMGNTDASMAFPDVQPNQSFNTVGMEAPIDIQKIDDQGHLVESYKNVPPGIQDLPTGPSEGTIIESPAAYQQGGFYKDALTSYNDSTASYNMQLQKNKLINEANASYGESYIRGVNQKKVANLTKKQKDLGIYLKDEPEYTSDKAYNYIRNKDNKIKYPKDADKTTYKTTSAESLKPTRNPEVSISPIEIQNLRLLSQGLAGELILPNNKLKYLKIRGKNKYLKLLTGEEVKIRQTGGLRNHMMNYLHTSGRDTNYVNTVMGAIAEHESFNNPDQIQISQKKDGTLYDGPGRGKYQYEVGDKKGGNTAMNRTKNFLDDFTDKTLLNYPKLKSLHKNKSLDFTKLSSKEQDAVFIGDKIYGGNDRANAFNAITKNRTTPPSREEVFKYWLTNHKGKVNGKSISELTEKEIEVERKKWNSRTKKIFKRGGYASKYIL